MGMSTQQIARRQLYKQNRLEGMSQIQSALKAGYKPKHAYKHAYKIERAVQGGIIETLNRMGLTDERLVEIARARIEKNEGLTGFSYWQNVCKMKNLIIEKPTIDQSNHEHVTINIQRTESKQNVHADQGSQERLHNDGEANAGTRLISLS